MNQLGVGSVRDRVHVERGHVRGDDFKHGHGHILTKVSISAASRSWLG